MLFKLKNTKVTGKGGCSQSLVAPGWPQEADCTGKGEKKTVLSDIKKPESPGTVDFKISSCSLYNNKNKRKLDVPCRTFFLVDI